MALLHAQVELEHVKEQRWLSLARWHFAMESIPMHDLTRGARAGWPDDAHMTAAERELLDRGRFWALSTELPLIRFACLEWYAFEGSLILLTQGSLMAKRPWQGRVRALFWEL